MFDHYENVQTVVLHNGVKVYVLEVPDCAYAYCNLVFGAGAVHDGDVHAGLAHFVEHMICANTGMSVMELNNFFAEAGGSFDAHTSWFGAQYGFKAPVSHHTFDDGLALWSRATLATTLEHHFEREQGIIASEFYQDYPSQAHAQLSVTRQRLLYRGLPHSAAPTVLGTIESIATITLDDVQIFHRAFYTPDNLSIVCVGGISLSQLCEKLLQCEIGCLPAVGNQMPANVPSSYLPRKSTRLVGDLSSEESAGQSTIVVSILIQRDVSRVALDVLCSMLSRMAFADIRENHGLAYSVRANMHAYTAYSMLEIVADDFPTCKLRVVERLIRRVIQRVSLEEALFERIKAQECVAYQMVDDTWQDVHEKMCFDIARDGRIQTATEELLRLEALQFADVLALLPDLNPHQFFTTVIHK